jgi:hypothetical protein
LLDIGLGWWAGQGGGWKGSWDGASVVDPVVLQDLVDIWSFAWVVVQYLADDVLGWVGNWDVVREGVGIHSDSSVGSLDIGCFEGWLTDDERVDYDSNRPHINLIGVTLLSLKNLRSNIVRSTANSTLSFSLELELSG